MSDTLSKYQIFCRIVETGSFTRVAEQLHYSQSAISQMVQALEREFGAVLVSRRKDGIILTRDGEEFFPYIKQIAAAEDACLRKRREMHGFDQTSVKIGGFSSIGRNVLPPVMKEYKKKYPGTRFVLRQGDYTDIRRWVTEDQVDFGFIDAGAAGDLMSVKLYSEPLMAILPLDHPLSRKKEVLMSELAAEPFIILDEGEGSSVRSIFGNEGLTLREEYSVYDDYSIISMVKQELGISVLFRNVLEGFDSGVAVRPIKEGPSRTMAVIWRKQSVMPEASRRFLQMLIRVYQGEPERE